MAKQDQDERFFVDLICPDCQIVCYRSSRPLTKSDILIPEYFKPENGAPELITPENGRQEQALCHQCGKMLIVTKRSVEERAAVEESKVVPLRRKQQTETSRQLETLFVCDPDEQIANVLPVGPSSLIIITTKRILRV